MSGCAAPPSGKIAAIAVRSFVAFESPGALSWGWAPIATFAVLAIVHWIGSTHALGRALARLPSWSYSIAYGACAALAIAFMNNVVQPFIYFQF